MRYILFKGDNGYVGGAEEYKAFSDDVDEDDLDEIANSIAQEYAEDMETRCIGERDEEEQTVDDWDEICGEYYENVTGSWEEITKEEFEEYGGTIL